MKQTKIIVLFVFVSLILLGIEFIYWSRIYIRTCYACRYTIQTEQRFVTIPSQISFEEQNDGDKMSLDNTHIHKFKKEGYSLYINKIKHISDNKQTKTTATTNDDYSKLTSPFHPRKLFIDMQDIKVSKDNIFFVETKCATKKTAAKYKKSKGLLLDVRQSCAVESTALANSDKDVYLLYSCPLSDDVYEYSPEHARGLLNYPNVHVVSLNMSQVLTGSPVQQLYERRLLETSSYPMEHASDVLRYTLLWKFGGTYSDLDVVTIRSFNGLKSNWAGQQDGSLIASGVMNFSPTGEGHATVTAALARMRRRFNGRVWGANGPEIITDTVLSSCNVTSVNEAMKKCQVNFTVLERKILYPIYYPSYGDLFNDKIGPKVVKKLKSFSYSVHIWNKMSHDSVVRVGSTQAYALLAKEYCPEVYRHCGDEF